MKESNWGEGLKEGDLKVKEVNEVKEHDIAGHRTSIRQAHCARFQGGTTKLRLTSKLFFSGSKMPALKPRLPRP